MTIEITYQNEYYTSFQYCVYQTQPTTVTFIFTLPDEPRVIESTAQVLPLAEEVTR